MRNLFGAVAPSVVICIFELADPAAADGAFAVGVPKDVANDGFSYGWTVGKAGVEEARSVAMEFCRKGRTGPDSGAIAAKKLCTIVGVFRDKCVAVSMDPGDGTPGVGWAIAATKDEAEAEALDNCKSTAGRSRAKFCQLSNSACDGDAK